jgi:hypothetical protein
VRFSDLVQSLRKGAHVGLLFAAVGFARCGDLIGGHRGDGDALLLAICLSRTSVGAL